jgi:pterin-4a-carbinolamine dehydratase
MRLFRYFIRFFTTEKQFDMLGRWKIDYDYNVINRKIDFANYDNCLYTMK